MVQRVGGGFPPSVLEKVSKQKNRIISFFIKISAPNMPHLTLQPEQWIYDD